MLAPTEQRVMVHRSRGRSLVQVAQRLGISYGAARAAAYRARKKLASAAPLSRLESVVLYLRTRGWACGKIGAYLAKTSNNVAQIAFRARQKLGI